MRSLYSLLFAAGCAALACVPAAAENSAGPAAQEPEERIICKKAAPAGTRFRTETCYTMAEWDKLSEVAKRDMSEMVFRDPKKKAVRRKPTPNGGKSSF